MVANHQLIPRHPNTATPSQEVFALRIQDYPEISDIGWDWNPQYLSTLGKGVFGFLGLILYGKNHTSTVKKCQANRTPLDFWHPNRAHICLSTYFHCLDVPLEVLKWLGSVGDFTPRNIPFISRFSLTP